MNRLSLSGPRLARVALFVARQFTSYSFVATRKFCSGNSSGTECDDHDTDDECLEVPVNEMWTNSYFDLDLEDVSDRRLTRLSPGERFLETTKIDAERVLERLREDGPGFDTQFALDELGVRVSGLLVRKVLFEILKKVSHSNKIRCAKIAFKFFVWSGNQGNYKHTTNSYHLLMKIFADCEEYKAMWRLVDEMVEKDLAISSRTLNMLICTCGELGLAKRVVEQFIKLKGFRFRPFKHSYNAILLSLLVMKQYKLVEWVYEKMLSEGLHSPDIFTYNVVMLTKHRLGKNDEFHNLLEELDTKGFIPDLYTYNIILHVLGMGDKPLAALNLMTHMRETGIEPSVLHFTTLIDGLGRAGNFKGCEFFFSEEMAKHGCVPDVVCFNVMINGYIAANSLEKAMELFDRMVNDGQAPNVFTYHALIRGLCIAGKFEEACSVLRDMESRGCRPNFLVYSMLVKNLHYAGKVSMAREIIKQIIEEGRYVHLVGKILTYQRT